MAGETLLAPQLVTNARMLYICWVPEDPAAAAALLAPGLKPAKNRAVYMNQYVVDRPEQTSGFGAYSLTYLGLDLDGYDLNPDMPGRYWTHYFNSSADMRGYAAKRGIPAAPGKTTLALDGDVLTCTTETEGRAVIRTTARIGSGKGEPGRGHLRYLTVVDGKLMSGRYAFVSEPVDPFDVLTLDFLDPSHSVYALRPKKPLELTFGFYTPRASFCYPGGEEPV